MTSPYLSIPEAVEYLRFTSAPACRKWLQRQRIPIVKRGARLLVLRASLDEALLRNLRKLA